MIDGNGYQTDGKPLSDSYFASGCIQPLSGVDELQWPLAEINQNAVYDAARRMSQYIRIVNRFQIVGYEVTGGNSVLWFKRHRIVSGVAVDLFDGIADEITSDAPSGGLTNEWLLDLDLLPYHTSESSVWKASAFADYWSQFDRCGFYAPELVTAANKPALMQVAYGVNDGSGNLAAELPSGFRYMRLPNGGDLNDASPTPADFYKSCQIYKRPYTILKAEEFFDENEYRVRIEIDGRLQNTVGETGGAPDSVSRDVSGWSAATIEAEPYRTDENGLRLYLLHEATGNNVVTTIDGDDAANSTAHLLPDNPFGSIYPRFYFTKLLPRPRADGNDKADASDAAFWHDQFPQMSLYLRAMCEGWIDTTKTGDDICQWLADNPGAAYPEWNATDYTFENLCYDAFEGRWLGMMPSETTDYIGEDAVRTEFPNGHGPLPNTIASSEMFNRFSAAIDKLTRVRLMLPLEIQCKATYYEDAYLLDLPDWPCSSSTNIVWYGEPKPARTINSGISDVAYGACPAATVSYADASTLACFESSCTGTAWTLTTDRKTTAYKIQLSDANAEYAIPEEWRDMVGTNTGRVGLLKTTNYRTVLSADGTSCDKTDFAPLEFKFTETVQEQSCSTGDSTDYEIVFDVDGVLDAGETPGVGFVVAAKSGGSLSCSGCDSGTDSHAIYKTLDWLNGALWFLEVPLVDVTRQS